MVQSEHPGSLFAPFLSIIQTIFMGAIWCVCCNPLSVALHPQTPFLSDDFTVKTQEKITPKSETENKKAET